MTRTAVVDIGTNSTRLLIADVEDGRVTHELARRSTVTRLGAGVDKTGRLQQDAIDRTLRVVHDYVQEAKDADKKLAVLTSATRDASNGQAFAQTIETEYGLTPHILSGDDEARFTFLGATSERDPNDATPTLVIDIGGGSTELVVGTGHQAGFHVSTQAGVVRQTERHLHKDPPTPDELQELAHDVRAILNEAAPTEPVAHAIAVAGTATSLAAIDLELEPYDPDKVHGYTLTRERVEQIRDRLAAVPLEQRRQTKGLHPDRAPTIVAGVVILLEVLNAVNLKEVEVSEHDILRGAALGLA